MSELVGEIEEILSKGHPMNWGNGRGTQYIRVGTLDREYLERALTRLRELESALTPYADESNYYEVTVQEQWVSNGRTETTYDCCNLDHKVASVALSNKESK